MIPGNNKNLAGLHVRGRDIRMITGDVNNLAGLERAGI